MTKKRIANGDRTIFGSLLSSVSLCALVGTGCAPRTATEGLSTAGVTGRDAAVCTAGTASEFQTCVVAANGGGVSEIDVTERIETKGIAGEDYFVVSGARGLLIKGISSATVTGPGFFRTGGYSPPSSASATLTIENSEGVNILGLTINDGTNIPLTWPELKGLSVAKQAVQVWTNEIDSICSATDIKNPCPLTSLNVASSIDVLVADCQFLESKQDAIDIYNDDNYPSHLSANIVIRHSVIQDSFRFGIWSGWSDSLSSAVSGLRVESNQFLSVRNNAVWMNTIAPAATAPIDRNTVTGNYFFNNQNADLFFECGANKNLPCPGGHLALAPQNDKLVVENNEFDCGGAGPGGCAGAAGTLNYFQNSGGVSGINIHGEKDVVVRNNGFKDNSWPGVFLYDDLDADVTGIYVYDNTFFNSGFLNYDSRPIASESFLNSSQNVKDLPTPTPPTNLGNCTLTAAQDVTDHGNCTVTADFTLPVPTGTISANPRSCTLLASGVCSSTISWDASTNPVSITAGAGSTLVVDNANDMGSVLANGITATPRNFGLYVGYTFLAGIWVAGE